MNRCFKRSMLSCCHRSYHVTSINTSRDTRTHYEILGVNQKATKDEIKKGFVNKSKKFHPDANVGSNISQDEMMKINHSYDILKNVQTKSEYDLSLGYSARERAYDNSQGPWDKRQSYGNRYQTYQDTGSQNSYRFHSHRTGYDQQYDRRHEDYSQSYGYNSSYTYDYYNKQERKEDVMLNIPARLFCSFLLLSYLYMLVMRYLHPNDKRQPPSFMHHNVGPWAVGQGMAYSKPNPMPKDKFAYLSTAQSPPHPSKNRKKKKTKKKRKKRKKKTCDSSSTKQEKE